MSAGRRAYLFSKSFSSCRLVSPSAESFGEAMRPVPEVGEEEEPAAEDRWSRILPELLGEIVRRVEKSEDRWPLRRSVVSCACVCRRWREVTTGVIGNLRDTGKITFPRSLKQVG